MPQMLARMERYFFRPGGTYGIAIARIFLFLGIYITYTKLPFSAGNVSGWYATVAESAYRPKGLVQLFWSAPPPIEFVETLLVSAQISTVMAAIGLLTRPAMVTSVLSVLFLHSLGYSFAFGWSHPHNVMFLVGLAFMFGRAGDHLSADALIRRWRGRTVPAHRARDGTYMWPLLLGQAAAALFYFGAFFAKFAGQDNSFDLSWVFSDSLRNMLIQPWFVADQALPWYVELTASHPPLWQLVAFGHLLTQAMPILACFSIHRPWLRLAEGIVFGAGVFSLGWFMSYWNEQWLLLLPFFVDWDYFGAWIRERLPSTLPLPGSLVSGTSPPVGAAQAMVHAEPYMRRRIVTVWATMFLTLYVATFTLRLGFVHFFYPFSTLDFFANVHALRPYAEHRHWPQNLGQISLVTDAGEMFVQPPKLGLIGRYRGRDKDQIDASIDQKRGLVVGAANEHLLYSEWKVLGQEERIRPARESIREVRYWGATVHFPAYPAPPGWATVFRGLLGAYEVGTTTVRVAHGELAAKGRTGEVEQLDLIIGGFQAPEVRLFFAPNPRDQPGPAELVELHGVLEFETGDSRGDLRGRFVLSPGQPLPWRAATLIEVREAGRAEAWPFIGPVAIW